MLSLRKPTARTIRAFLAAQSRLKLTYPTTGANGAPPPAGFVVDHTRLRLGAGAEVFAAARTALEHWRHFHLGWVQASPENTPIRVGEVVGILVWTVGLWWLNASRILAVVDEDGPTRRFGFTYGTLPGHAESGEERFTIEWDREDDGVWYDILAFSRPHYFLARLGYPMVRRLQKRFARESAAAMRREVSAAAGTTH